MFWGLVLKSGRKYTQMTEQPFHISQVALDHTTCRDQVQLFLSYKNKKYLICTLRKNVAEQVMLDLNFDAGEEITFFSEGVGTIYVSGYVTEMCNDEDDDDDGIEELIAEATEKEKKKQQTNKNAKKKGLTAKNEAEENENDSDEDDGEFDELEGDSLEEGEEEDEDEEEDNDSDDESEDEDEDAEDEDEEVDEDDDQENSDEDAEISEPKAKIQKVDKAAKQNGLATTAKKGKKEKQEKVAPGKKSKDTGMKVLSGGVKIEDIRVGNGPEVKAGKKALVYYQGRLKQNNKVFDSVKQGTPFKFNLGRGDVIKGWDIGVEGMKVGGKRLITCPPHMAYGASGSPPTIPPNSTLVFEVELKGVA